jgi:general secretion pathway protein G
VTVRTRRPAGFTLIELVVVLAIVGLLASLAMPRFSAGLERSKETVLRQNLAALRSAIDQYRADTGALPQSLDDLVARRYLREVPLDPVTEARTTWVPVPAPADAEQQGVFDVRSGAPGTSSDGSPYSDW